MYDDILFPTDGSDAAESVLEYALDIAAEEAATIHALNVADTNVDSLVRIQDQVIDALEQAGQEFVEAVATRARERGVPVTTEVSQGDPYSTIIAYADRCDADLIVIPTQGRQGIKRFLLGSVTERVINHAEIPVIAVNPKQSREPRYPPRHLLIPTDGSRGSELAVAEGIELANAIGATVHLLHVVETGGLGPDARSLSKESELKHRANDILSQATTRVEATGIESYETAVESGEPSRAIRDYMEEYPIDLTVMGTHGTTNFSRYVLGGVSAKIVRTAPIPVMWVREPDSP